MTTTLQTHFALLPAGNDEAYINRILAVPMLSADEEQSLAMRWHEYQDVEAAKRLVMAHMRFVVRVAKGYAGYGLQLADLIQEGNIGLMKAVKRFNPHLGVRLVSFAVHWIKSEIHEFIIRNWRVVKIATTKAQRKLFFNLRSMKKRLGWFSREEMQNVAHELGVTVADVQEMESRLNAYDTMYDAPPSDNDESNQRLPAPADYLADQTTDPALLLEHNNWEQHAAEALERSLATLKPRERHIIQQRWLVDTKKTLLELAHEMGISAERIRQIEKAAIVKLKEAIQ